MIDFEKIKHYFQIFSNLRYQDLESLFKNSKWVNYKSGDVLIEFNSLKRQVGYITKGLVRVYKVKENGEEVTLYLRWEDQYVAPHDVILFNKPSSLEYKCMEKTSIILIDYDVLQKIITENPKFEQVRKYILLKTIGELMEKLESFLLKSPEERYLSLILSNPSLNNRVPDKYLANIIGITPVSLSRIRKRISQIKK